MERLTRRFGVLHIAFIGVVGLAGWIAVTAVTVWPPLWLRPWQITWEFGAVLGLASAARFLAFTVFRRVRIALDSVFYVASAFAFGVVPAAWMVLIVRRHGAVGTGNGIDRKGDGTLAL